MEYSSEYHGKIFSCLWFWKVIVYYCIQMPTTIEDLEAAIDETTSQANSILLLNQNILKEYEDRQRKVIPFDILFFLTLPTLFFDLSPILAT